MCSIVHKRSAFRLTLRRCTWGFTLEILSLDIHSAILRLHNAAQEKLAQTPAGTIVQISLPLPFQNSCPFQHACHYISVFFAFSVFFMLRSISHPGERFLHCLLPSQNTQKEHLFTIFRHKGREAGRGFRIMEYLFPIFTAGLPISETHTKN